jgi:hypothetical protein
MKFLWTIPLLFLAPLAVAAQGPPAPYSVNLSWTASTTPGVTGENVYRAPLTGTTCGAYANLTTTPLAGTTVTWSDNSVVGGQNYCYGVTSLNGTAESSLSNVCQVSIPPAPPTNLSATVK